MSNLNYRETFFFPDIPTQPYPVYVLNKNGKITNFKSIVYPSTTSCKRYTRKKQLKNRSLQSKIFDSIINIGYFDPLVVYREFPIPIQNCYRLDDQKRLFHILDYYFPTLNLAVELDSDYHDNQIVDPDNLRDEYLKKAHSIEVIRIRDLQKESVQKTEFKKLTKRMRELNPNNNIIPLIFNNDLYKYLDKKGL